MRHIAQIGVKPFFAILVLLFSVQSFAQAALAEKIETPKPPEGTWKRGKMSIAKAEGVPKIDGNLDDLCWQNATHGLGFFRLLSKDPVEDQTEVWICADDKKLYFAFHCLDREPNKIVAKETQRNGNLNQDDRVAVVIDSQSAKRSSSEFWTNPIGTQAQNIEGGTADNQAWQGDWQAAAKRTPDGWIAEMAIPFSLLRYPKGAQSFGILVARRKPMESNFSCWPYMPPQSDTGSMSQYFTDFGGIKPPTYAAKPIILPYMLSTTGQGTSSRFGLDLKYPISTAFTGVATIKPDFQTVEGAVQDVTFSYTEKYVPDRRPFFAEGEGFLDDSSMFYSQRIQDVDYGIKVTGKQGPTTIGVLGTMSQTGSRQSAAVATFSQDIGAYSGYGATYVHNQQENNGGDVWDVHGEYGWAKGLRNVRFYAEMRQSQSEGGKEGRALFANINTYAGKGQWNGNFFTELIDANYRNPLGLINETDRKAVALNLSKFHVFDKGRIEQNSVSINADTVSHIDGSFFHDNMQVSTDFTLRSGFGYGMYGQVGKRNEFHDNTLAGYFQWNQKTLLQKGTLAYEIGRRENKPYRYISLGQGFGIGKALSFNLSVGDLRVGDLNQTQTILSGTYRIDPRQSFGGRLVTQDGHSNLYLSYGKRGSKGNDLFILLGDPNSPTTKKAITLKMVWSL
jgi:hypothetical protein